KIESSINDGLGKALGLVNLCKTLVQDLLPTSIFLPQTTIPDEYRLYSHKFRFLTTHASHNLDYLLVALEPNGWDVITAIRFSTEGSRSVTIVAYTDKLLPSAPLKKVRYDWDLVMQSVSAVCTVDFLGKLMVLTDGFVAKRVNANLLFG